MGGPKGRYRWWIGFILEVFDQSDSSGIFKVLY